MPRQLTIDGYTTVVTDREFLTRVRTEIAERFPDGPTDEQWRKFATPLLERYVSAMHVAQYHNGLVPLAVEQAKLDADVRRLLIDTDHAYQDLSNRTTTAWHAAHHRYVVLIEQTRQALVAQLAGATAMHDYHEKNWSGVTTNYDRFVDAADRIPTPVIDPLVATSFMERTTARLTLLSHTLAGTLPEAFAPAADPIIPAQARREPYRLV